MIAIRQCKRLGHLRKKKAKKKQSDVTRLASLIRYQHQIVSNHSKSVFVYRDTILTVSTTGSSCELFAVEFNLHDFFICFPFSWCVGRPTRPLNLATKGRTQEVENVTFQIPSIWVRTSRRCVGSSRRLLIKQLKGLYCTPALSPRHCRCWC